MKDTIYTLNEAVEITELFEDVLQRNGIKLPSPEDDEREEGNDAALYGSTYSDLVDEIENRIIDILERYKESNTYEYGILNEPFTAENTEEEIDE